MSSISVRLQNKLLCGEGQHKNSPLVLHALISLLSLNYSNLRISLHNIVLTHLVLSVAAIDEFRSDVLSVGFNIEKLEDGVNVDAKRFFIQEANVIVDEEIEIIFDDDVALFILDCIGIF